MANSVTGSFTGTGQSASFLVKGVDDGRPRPLNISISGTFVASMRLERSFDNGSTWLPKTAGGDSGIYTYTGPISDADEEEEAGVLYRLNCTSYTSGTANYRLSN